MLDEQLKSRIKFLKNLRVFKKASDSELEGLAKSLHDQIVHKGETIICKGDVAENMYIIAKGKVKIHDGKHTLNEVGKGHVFGEYSLFHTHIRTASVTTLKTTYLLKLSQKDFKKLLKNNPDVQLAVIESLIDTIAVQNQLEKELALKNKQIKTQKKQLEKLIKTKDRFFSLVAHDLRSPLSSLSSYLNLLINSDLLSREEIIEYASEIQGSIENVVEMLNNLLNWAVSETGEWKMVAENFNIPDSLDRVVNLYRSIADKKEIQLINKSEPLTVYADKNSVDIIIRNLVSNAINYTPRGGIVELDTKEESGFVVVSVMDNGIGMDKATVDNLFSIEIKSNVNQMQRGTGLGLLLVKEITAKNGGFIHFESTLKKGTTFFIRLPIGK
jgi:signal transduction histidine kinase